MRELPVDWINVEIVGCSREAAKLREVQQEFKDEACRKRNKQRRKVNDPILTPYSRTQKWCDQNKGHSKSGSGKQSADSTQRKSQQ
jgi:hypothetical protein